MEILIDGVRYLPVMNLPKDPLPFYELISDARAAKKETLQEAANGIGTTKSHLWSLEMQGSIPRLPMLQKILKYYGIKFEAIADEF